MGEVSSSKARRPKGKIRCAIYTRKSSEEGLERLCHINFAAENFDGKAP